MFGFSPRFDSFEQRESVPLSLQFLFQRIQEAPVRENISHFNLTTLQAGTGR